VTAHAIADAGATRTFVQIPTDVARPAVPAYQAGACAASLTIVDDVAATEAQARLLAAIAGLLQRYTQQAETGFDLFVERQPGVWGRRPLQTPLSSDASLERAIAQMAGAIAGAVAESDGAPRGAPTSNIAVSLWDGDVPTDGPTLASALGAGSAPGATYDLHFVVSRRGPPTRIALLYNAFLLRSTTASRLLANVATLFVGLQTRPAAALRQLPVLSADEEKTIKVAWDSGRALYADLPVHRLFERLAREQPEALAAVCKDRRITYGELEAASNRLAHFLLSRGCGEPLTHVAVCVKPSIDILISILAIFKCGAIYVPIDPTHPAALIASILEEVQPRLVLTQTAVSEVASPDRFTHFCFDRDWPLVDAQPVDTTQPPNAPVTLAHRSHVFYTSGTTGKPKGVVALHRNVAHFINVAQQRFGFNRSDAFVSMARYTFSISFFELLFPLCCGGSVRLIERETVLDPPRLTEVLKDVTVLHAGPSLLSTLIKFVRDNPVVSPSFERIRHVSTGGDLVPAHVLEQMKPVFRNAEIFVIYGCTENNCMGTYYFADRARKVDKSYVGKPFPDVLVRILDPDDNLVPIGAVGDICFSGKGVVEGYLNRPELNAQKFTVIDGDRYYHTGDMGRLDDEGNIEILGRRDFQIQLRGIRIELGGIENAVRELGLATHCALVVKKLDEQDMRLVAFVVNPRVKTVAELRKELGRQLPDYMLPQAMVVLDALPVTRNNKLDRAKLQELPWQPPSGSQSGSKAGEKILAGGPDRTPAEIVIADAFAAALGLKGVGLDDDFFDLGGQSLLAVTVTQAIENKLGVQLPSGAIFEHKTVRALAAHAQSSFKSEPRAIRLSGDDSGLPLFLLLGVHIYRPLAQRLPPEYATYAVYSARELTLFGPSDERRPSVPDLARDYVEIIRRQQEHGPYRIAGFSFGGVLAFEVARQLRERGDETIFVGLLDTMLPQPRGWRRHVGQLNRFATITHDKRKLVVTRKLRRLVERRVTVKGAAAFVVHEEDSELGRLERQRAKVYDAATGVYLHQIEPFDGLVTLFTANRRLDEDPLQDPSCGWESYTPKLEVRALDADHADLLTRDTAVARLALLLGRSLKRADALFSFRTSAQ
jgi:amino acid adenylation domain-containing protein